jgi:Glyoxalase-like domain
MPTDFQVVIDCADPARLSAFWAAALGYELQPPPSGFASWEAFLRQSGVPEDEWNSASALVDPEGKRPRVYFQRVPEGKVAKNRLHLDLSVGGGQATPLAERRVRVDAEVARLTALGATDERGPIEKDGEYWVRMNDPEGNEFCVQ